MNFQRVLQRSLPAAAAVLVGAASVASAQERQVFEWTGRVDREVQVSMRNNQLWSRGIGNNESNRSRSRVFSTLPHQDGNLMVRVLDGRGNVDVLQQPSAQNGYTATVRIMDRSGGADMYRLVGYWQAYANGDYNMGRGRGRGRGNNRDVWDDNRRDDDRRGDISRDDTRALRWSGSVDDELEIRIQNGRVDYRTLRGSQPTNIRSDLGNTSPRYGNGTLYVTQSVGRGAVTVIQQPSTFNGYTTVIRVKDPQSGSSFYSFDLMWQ